MARVHAAMAASEVATQMIRSNGWPVSLRRFSAMSDLPISTSMATRSRWFSVSRSRTPSPGTACSRGTR